MPQIRRKLEKAYCRTYLGYFTRNDLAVSILKCKGNSMVSEKNILKKYNQFVVAKYYCNYN
jgi:hypothetical protein